MLRRRNKQINDVFCAERQVYEIRRHRCTLFKRDFCISFDDTQQRSFFRLFLLAGWLAGWIGKACMYTSAIKERLF